MRPSQHVAAAVLALPADRVRRVAVDGVDGAGKTRFADAVGAELTVSGAKVIRASADGFLNPPRTRHRRGRDSPEGFYRDSYDYGRMVRLLLDPLSPGGNREYIREVYDIRREREVRRLPELADDDAILVFDGIFTHRDELIRYWDYSVWLEVPFEVSIPRAAQREKTPDADPQSMKNRRYVGGQRLYMAECHPRDRATVVIDNADLTNPVLLG
ncbi:uridine kinase [Actinophytocola oryzae]|uniref:Uridine kinase n=1 Tax=Actinophytocola oryzae TaxID=502181 RepID=A0A4R7V093_9PSEU|nr:uridine kinase [Actinophytocola oryzae]TDV42673.1 uridine kinase [Actinophytocola oryzae]